MKTKRKDQRARLTGEEIKDLQEALKELGFLIDDDVATLGPSTRRAVRQFQERQGLKPTSTIDRKTVRLVTGLATVVRQAPTEEARQKLRDFLRRERPVVVPAMREPIRFVVRGRVVGLDGKPRSDLRVRAFDKDLACGGDRVRHREQPLGSAVTDAQGRYQIQYDAKQFGRTDTRRADVIVRVFGHSRKPLAESPTRFNARPIEIVDLVVETKDDERSEFERLEETLAPFQQCITNLKPEDVTFLSGETGLPALHIALYAAAQRHAQVTKLPAVAFYGSWRQNGPTALLPFLLQRKETVRQALTTSLHANIIPASFEQEIEKTVDGLEDRIDSNGMSDAGSLRGLLEAAGLSAELQPSFLKSYVRRNGSLPDFWKSLSESPLKDRVDDLQTTLQLGLLTGNNVPLVKALRAKQVRTPRDVVRLGAEGLKQLIAGSKAILEALPPSTADETATERAARAAEEIIEVLNAALPTVFLSVGLEKVPEADLDLVRHVVSRNPGIDLRKPTSEETDWSGLNAAQRKNAQASLETLRRELNMFPELTRDDVLGDNGSSPSTLNNQIRRDVSRVLANAPALELRDEHLDRFIAQEGKTLFEGVANPEAAMRQLKCFQRAMRVAPDHSHSVLLLEEGLDSARAITGLSQTAFLRMFESRLGGRNQAMAYYQKAWQISGAVTGVSASLLQSANDLLPAVILKAPNALKTQPNLTTLFGSAGLCQCQHCRSVYGPAAYLVDLLQFLNPKAGPNPLSILRARRPDIEHIPLTCENTHTPLPYLDLVSEILEFYVVHKTLTKNAAHDTGSAVAEELRVNPQFTLDEAYTTLQGAAGSPLLPFHRPLEVSRVYLEHLGSSRAQVMRTFRKAGVPDESDIWNESLRISAAERDILVGDDPRPMREFYGYLSDTVVLDDAGVSQTENWQKNVSKVLEFLKRTGITYAQLVELLATQFLNGQSPVMVLQEPGDYPQCDLRKTTVQHLTAARLQKIHRFLRLTRKVGWTIPELDWAFSVFGAADITPEFLRKVARAKALEADLKMTRPALFSLWSPLETRGDAALYRKLFQNKAVLHPLDLDFGLNEAGTELLSAVPFEQAKTLSEKSAALQSALRLSSEELSALRAAAGLSDESAKLTLDHLSRLYRFVALARALELKLRDFLSLLALTGDQPFAATEPAPTLAFVERARRVKASRFSVVQLDYLYRSSSPPIGSLEPQTERTTALIKELREGLHTIIEETTSTPDATEDVVRSKLADVLNPELIDPAMGVIHGAAMPEDKAAFIDEHFAVFIDNLDEAKAALLGPSGSDAAETKKQKRAFVLKHLMSHIQKLLSRGFVKKTLSDEVKIESRVGELLLESLLNGASDPAARAITDFLALADIAIAEEAAVFTFNRLHKAALLINGFKITRDELEYLSAHAAQFADFDLNNLPVHSDDLATDLFRQWERLHDLFALRDSLPEGEAGVFDVFKSSSAAEALETLKKATGWNPEQLDFLASADGFNLASVDDFANETTLLPVRDCLALSRRLGLSCDELFEWASAEPTADGARQVVNAAKSKYSPEQWLPIGRPLNDLLREAQRSALVAYLLGQDSIVKKGITSVNGLYEYFLIDVEMSGCMPTSRIRQAIASVQLFIQRCLMNLEPQVSPSSIDADQWSYLKYFRVSEATRKIFLYPENWLLAELRDNKTPFFAELESQLLQSDLTRETAEQAFLTYLQKLDDVAKLEVCGVHTQEDVTDGESTAIVHVFGRTTDSPHVLYHRQLLDHTTWTPWEKVDMDVESDHLIPVSYNRRLYLFWPVFEEKPDKDAKLPGPYVQSPEHWKWVKDHQKWEADHQTWTNERNNWQDQKDHLQDEKNAAETMLDGAKAANDPELIKHWDDLVTSLEEQLQDLEQHEPKEPREPSEPQFSIEPTLTNWHIKLAWTELYQGKWSARRTSTESVVSPFVHATLKQVRKQLGLDEPDAADIGPDDTIVTVYLPEKEKHFFRTRVETFTGDLVITAYRRYLHKYSAFYLDAVSSAPTLRSYEQVGTWRLYSGAKVRADSTLTPVGDYSLDFRGPAGTDNSFMMFADDTPQALTFMADGAEPRPVFQSIPALADRYTVATDHGYPQFSLKPPFQRFIYQDKLKTYMASYTADQPFAPLAKAALADVVLDLSPDDPLIKAVKASAADSVADTAGAILSKQWLGKVAGANSVSISGVGNLAPFLKFDTFFHPHVAGFVTELYRKGVPGLLARSIQATDNDKNGTNVFVDSYKPGKIVHWQRPREHVDFGAGAYATYNWELFFHAPMLIAESLSRNQRFAEALEWFHFIFNPTTSSDETSPRRFWNTLPFYNNSQPEKHHIQYLLLALSSNAPELASLRDDVEHQIREWREDPANPHLIARLRITAYQKNVVMKYLDTVINWADMLFALDRPETVDEACFLYVLASNILGRRPDIVPSPIKILPKTYHQLSLKGLDDFSNALVAFENEFPYAPPAAKMVPYAKKTGVSSSSLQANAGIALKSVPQTLYFCIPPNAELLEYWNRVEDRLFKIRHCLNIEGVARQLPLFDPPIDPALLVKARAAGLDPFSVLSDLHAPLPSYRFSASLQKALEMASELKSLGATLLSTIEKKDGERLAALRASHEGAVLRAVRDVRKQQIEEAKQTLEGLHRSKAVVEARRDFYKTIEKISDFEQEHMDALSTAHVFNEIAQGLQAAVSTGFLTPDIQAGTAGSFGSPLLTVKLGGTNLGHAAQALAGAAGMIASQFSHDAQMASLRGGYERRWQEWKHQQNLAEKELAQLNKQIIAAEIRQSIAEKELENHERQIENAAAVESFLREKYTNEGLYTWMQGQVSKVFFQAYKLAYDLAKRAERAYRFECGPEASASISFGYWDNLRSGLLSGEKLFLDLKRLEAAHADENKRELEITKHVSLDALELVRLRESGWCEMDLPEFVFDTDIKGHIWRRIRRVGLTIPCTIGPYTSVNCTLTLLTNKIRVKNTLKIGAADPYLEDADGDDRFVSNFATTQSIVTSQAVNDTGSELTFRDDRYLPFEGAGAISTWRIELTREKHLRQFDYDTISGVVLHLTYTARDGGEVLRKAARESLEKKMSESKQVRLFSARHEFSSEWHRFLKPAESQTNHVLKMDLIRERFPFLYRNRQLTLTGMELFLKFKDEVVPLPQGQVLPIFVRSPATDATLDTGSLPGGKFTSDPKDNYAGLPHLAVTGLSDALFGTWQIEVRKKDVQTLLPDLKRVVPDSNTAEQPLSDLVAALEDIYVVCHYAIGEAVD